MSPERLVTLNEAIRAGTPLTVRYHDGARHAVYTILPTVTTDRLLRARDLVTWRWRIFLLRDLEILVDGRETASAPEGSSPSGTAETLPR